ncbi:unnamed protein product [Pedinophyceae sp. YPF-701]|nr:unnamed protein product [Pedinophyceae sp. YPF-701]
MSDAARVEPSGRHESNLHDGSAPRAGHRSSATIEAIAAAIPWLRTNDRGALARTCRRLRDAVAADDLLFTRDISRGAEPRAIPLTRPGKDAHLRPPPHRYVRTSVARLGNGALVDPPDGPGCDCSAPCGPETACPCLAGQSTAQPSLAPSILECGPRCACAAHGCPAALSSRGAQRPCELRWTGDGRGWGLFATADVPPHALVLEYAGEILSTGEARRRLAQYDEARMGHALLVVREVLPSGVTALRTNVDATRVGNAARFVNHACGSAATCVLGVVRRRGSLLPRVGVFAGAGGVGAGQELTFSYCFGAEGEADGPEPERGDRVRCLCGAPDCMGFLPRSEA